MRSRGFQHHSLLSNLVSSSFLKSPFCHQCFFTINATFAVFYRKTADDGTSTSIPYIFLGLCLGSSLRCREHSVMNRLSRGTWVVVLAPVVPVQSFLSRLKWKVGLMRQEDTFFLLCTLVEREFFWRRLTP